jgi:hypothetical protein
MVSEKRNDLEGKALDLPLGILGTPMYPITLGGLN